MTEKFLPLAAMEKLLKQGGAERVSDKAKVALKNALEDIAHEIAVKSIKLAVHAGRKTVKSEDIKLAVKE
jgi:histone H3/H4